MTLLPKNEPHKTIDIPRNFFIYGKTMSGKSYLAERFPNPVFLNTDGNSLANKAPSIQLKNERNENGTLKISIIDQLDEIMLELQTMNKKPGYGFETVVVDVIDDVATMIEQAVALENNVKTLADVPYGKGFAAFNSVLQGLVMELKALPMNVIYISRIDERQNDSGETIEVPSLKVKYYNVVNGNCDLVIHTKKIGTRYVRSITDKRKDYFASRINDPKILNILKAIPGAIQPEPQTQNTENKVGK
ncbi:AAA family ATPase [Lentilactobacillus senioris]|uniref:AAA family ATPase n=1 Tax=Lentilactobacillus senioris TaxID=931534 RepID=UPI003D2C6C9F